MDRNAPAEVVGRRIGAALVDILLLAVVFVLYAAAFGQSRATRGHAAVAVHGILPTVVWLVLVLAYFFFSELLAGQTLGKRLLRIRVMSRAGDRPTVTAIALRTILRVVDWLPFLYLVGFLAVLASRGRAQRLGDLAAGTKVVPVSPPQ